MKRETGRQHRRLPLPGGERIGARGLPSRFFNIPLSRTAQPVIGLTREGRTDVIALHSIFLAFLPT